MFGLKIVNSKSYDDLVLEVTHLKEKLFESESRCADLKKSVELLEKKLKEKSSELEQEAPVVPKKKIVRKKAPKANLIEE